MYRFFLDLALNPSVLFLSITVLSRPWFSNAILSLSSVLPTRAFFNPVLALFVKIVTTRYPTRQAHYPVAEH